MEIITLVRANIRRKKGTFISIAILMAITACIITVIFSVKENNKNAVSNAYEYAGWGDFICFANADSITDDVKVDLVNCTIVDRAEFYKALTVHSVSVGENERSNIGNAAEVIDGIRLYNDAADGFTDTIPALEKGEVYVPYTFTASLKCSVGDTITAKFLSDKEYKFTIRGFVQEPAFGSDSMGWKLWFMNGEDMARISAEEKNIIGDGNGADSCVINVFKASGCDMNGAKFRRQVNLDTKIIDYSYGSQTRDMTVSYTTMLPEILMNIVEIFGIFLFIIVLIVMGHSIGTELEIDYTALGVMKAIGMTTGKIRIIFMIQYLIAQIIGICAGIVIALPLEHVIAGTCMTSTGILPVYGIAAAKVAAFVLAVFISSAVIIIFSTRKLGKISPMRAISGGRESVYFDSRLNAPISGKLLSMSIALRQFTSNKLRYVGIIGISAILVFFMMTMDLTVSLLDSWEAQAQMGLQNANIVIDPVSSEYSEDIIELENTIKDGSYDVAYVHRYDALYLSLDGENVYCEITDSYDMMGPVLKGRLPQYDNELMITSQVKDALDLAIGDEVTVSYKDKDEKFIVSGIFQRVSDSGMAFSIHADGAKKLGVDLRGSYLLIDGDKDTSQEIKNIVEEKYSDKMNIVVYDKDESFITEAYGGLMTMLRVIIYTFSIIFAVVTVRLVCVKSFILERRDIGIFKAVGFTSSKLRMSFGLRFTITAIIGGILGTVLSVLFSANAIGFIMSLIGLSKVIVEYSAETVIIPVLALSVFSFIFAYIASGRIKKVAVRELVIE